MANVLESAVDDVQQHGGLISEEVTLFVHPEMGGTIESDIVSHLEIKVVAEQIGN